MGKPVGEDSALGNEGTTTAAAPFCGSAGSGCSVEDDKKLREAFLAEVKAHGYHDAECRSELKAYFCAVCLRPSAPADDDPLISGNSNTSTTAMNNSSSLLPLRCAGAATVMTTLNSISTAPTAPKLPRRSGSFVLVATPTMVRRN